MAGIRAGVLLSAGLLTWLVAQGPLAPYRRALLDTTPSELVLVLGGDVDLSLIHISEPTRPY